MSATVDTIVFLRTGMECVQAQALSPAKPREKIDNPNLQDSLRAIQKVLEGTYGMCDLCQLPIAWTVMAASPQTVKHPDGTCPTETKEIGHVGS
jgi:hypothetical protein